MMRVFPASSSSSPAAEKSPPILHAAGVELPLGHEIAGWRQEAAAGELGDRRAFDENIEDADRRGTEAFAVQARGRRGHAEDARLCLREEQRSPLAGDDMMGFVQ